MADGIFISYKRGADSADARTLYSALNETFPERVRMDVDSFPLGEDFVAHISEEMDKCHVVLVVVGRGFHERLDELQSDGDFMRLELEQAMEAEGKKIIPVFFDGATMPSKEVLPETLAGLVFRGGLKVDHENAGIILRHKLIPDLKRIFEALPPAPAPEPVEDTPEPKKIAEHITREYLQDAGSSNAVTRIVSAQKPANEDLHGKSEVLAESGPSFTSKVLDIGGEAISRIDARVSWAMKFAAPMVLVLAAIGAGYATNSSFAGFVDRTLGWGHVSGLKAGIYKASWNNTTEFESQLRLGQDGELNLGPTTVLQPEDLTAYYFKPEKNEFRSDGGFTLKPTSPSTFEWRNHRDENVTLYEFLRRSVE